MKSKLSRISATVALVAAFCVVLAGQRGTSPPQPVAGKLPAVGAARPSRGVLVEKPAAAMPGVPDGLTVSVYAGLQAPRLMVYAPNGDLFVSSPASNSITVLRDANNDGVFESRGVYAQGEVVSRGGGAGAAPAPAAPPPAPAPAAVVNPAVNGPILGADAPACVAPQAVANRGPGTLVAPFGMAFHDGYLYVGTPGAIIRFKYTTGDLKAQDAPEKLLDLPTGGHSTRNIVFNRAGTKMYVAVGSQSNNNAGEDCRRAAVLEFNPDGTGYRVYASGIRNPVGLALQPGSDTLWTAVNERDNLGDDLVPDYTTSIKDGGFYGWPYSYIGQNPDPRYVGGVSGSVKRAIVPDVLIPAHLGCASASFSTGTQFPQRYRNGAFVALHGSWNRSTASGYKVVFFLLTNGKPGPIEDLMTGFLVNDGAAARGSSGLGTPGGVTVARDGSLLVSDAATGSGRSARRWQHSIDAVSRGPPRGPHRHA